MCSTRYGGPRDVYENHRIAAKARGRDAVKGWKGSISVSWMVHSKWLYHGETSEPMNLRKAGYFQQLPQLRRRPLMVELPLMNLIEFAAVLQELPLRSPCMVSYFCSLFFWHSWCKVAKLPGLGVSLCQDFVEKHNQSAYESYVEVWWKQFPPFSSSQKEPLAVRACLRLQVGSRGWEPQPWRIHQKIRKWMQLKSTWDVSLPFAGLPGYTL